MLLVICSIFLSGKRNAKKRRAMTLAIASLAPIDPAAAWWSTNSAAIDCTALHCVDPLHTHCQCKCMHADKWGSEQTEGDSRRTDERTERRRSMTRIG